MRSEMCTIVLWIVMLTKDKLKDALGNQGRHFVSSKFYFGDMEVECPPFFLVISLLLACLFFFWGGGGYWSIL